MGLDRYVKALSFKVTLVSLVGDGGFEWVGPPQQFPVDRLQGQQLVAHNAEFDSVCARMAMARGQMPPFEPADWSAPAAMT